jgi:hypothetical protein
MSRASTGLQPRNGQETETEAGARLAGAPAGRWQAIDGVDEIGDEPPVLGSKARVARAVCSDEGTGPETEDERGSRVNVDMAANEPMHDGDIADDTNRRCINGQTNAQ